MRNIPRLSFAIIGVLCIGCAREAAIERAPISGRVTFEGKPLSHGQVIMMDAAGHLSVGEIAADGTYGFDAVIGDNKVAIICRDEPNLSQLDPEVGRPLPVQEPASLIPERYMTVATSELTATVTKGDNVQDFNLDR